MKYKNYYISFMQDCEENAGGYYCEIYLNENLDELFDYFCIHEYELKENDNVVFWIKKYIDEILEG